MDVPNEEAWFEAAPDAQLLTDVEGSILRANEQARVLLGVDDEPTDEQLLDHVIGRDQPTIRDFLAGIEESDEVRDRWRVECASNAEKPIPVDLTARAVGTGDDKVVLWSMRRTPEAEDVQANRFTAARLKALVETAVDAIITIDQDGIIHSFNPAAEEIFGYESEEIIGRNVSELMPQPHRDKHDGYIQRYLETGQKRIIGIGREVEGIRRDGSRFPMELAVSELDLGGRTMFTGIVKDISERKEAERERKELIEQLEQKNAELERFTYTVSHDLKSPLITIKGFAGMLVSDAEKGDIDRLREDSRRIADAAEKMKGLLDELLELSRIGRVVNPSEDVDLSELAVETIELLSGPIDEKGVDIDVAPDLPVVYGDRVRLQEVFQNLIENAVKFLGEAEEPRIEIGTEERAGRDVIFVRDNGKGVAEEYLDKVFGLFEQLDPREAGSGVGLTLVQRIVDVHGGRIWVDSEGEGEGATFYFTLQEEDRETPGISDD